MPRPRRYTEHLGLSVSVVEERIIKEYTRSRKMTVADYFREVAVQPLLARQDVQPAEGKADGLLSPVAQP